MCIWMGQVMHTDGKWGHLKAMGWWWCIKKSGEGLGQLLKKMRGGEKGLLRGFVNGVRAQVWVR